MLFKYVLCKTSSNKQSWLGIHEKKVKLPEIEREKTKIVSQKTKKQQLEWHRERVLALLAEDYSQNEIASILQVSPASISKDVSYLKDQSRLLLRIHLKEIFSLEYQEALTNLKSTRREAREMLRKPETDDRIKARLFIVVKDITESIMNLVVKGDEIDDSISFMEDKTAEAKEHVNSVKREGGGEDEELKQQEDVGDQAVF